MIEDVIAIAKSMPGILAALALAADPATDPVALAARIVTQVTAAIERGLGKYGWLASIAVGLMGPEIDKLVAQAISDAQAAVTKLPAPIGSAIAAAAQGAIA